MGQMGKLVEVLDEIRTKRVLPLVNDGKRNPPDMKEELFVAGYKYTVRYEENPPTAERGLAPRMTIFDQSIAGDEFSPLVEVWWDRTMKGWGIACPNPDGSWLFDQLRHLIMVWQMRDVYA